ncbi:MAG: hypothetical protein ABIP30_00140 [Ferruginibacter sp.]
MEQASKIILRRKSQWMNRMRGYKVFINNVQLGIIKNDSTEEYITEPGLKLVKCKVDWCGSPPKELMLKPGEVAYLEVKSNLKYFTYLYILVLVGIFGRFALRSGEVEMPKWATICSAAIFIVAFLYMTYFLTLGRNKYLMVDTEKDNVFAK